jgi:tetratricopeptide (TPR) repeat protein
MAACRPQSASVSANVPAQQGALHPVAVGDDDFSAFVHRLLRDSRPTPDRLGLLAGVVSRQLTHAGERFGTGQQERGLASLSGAFYLVRAGEFRSEMLSGAGPAIASAVSLVAPRGDEGRAVALLSMQSSLITPGTPARRDNDEHLAALRTWMKETRKNGSLESLGAEQRVQALRSMVEPSAESLSSAREATVHWIDQSLRMSEERKSGGVRPQREDALEALRAFRSGAESLAALYLRHGDAAGALADLNRTASVDKITPPSLRKCLENAANGGGARAWRDLLAWLWSPDRKDSPNPAGTEGDPEFAIDPNLLRGAIFGTAIEAYRLDPRAPEVSFALATLLVQLGMPEAAPAVLADAVPPGAPPDLLSGSLGLVLKAIQTEEEADDTATARRIYAAAAPLIAIGSKPDYKGRLAPGVGQLRLTMGVIETHAGNLDAARSLLESSASTDPTVEALVTLAAIDRQAGKTDAALAQLARALSTTEAKRNPLAAGEAHLNVFEIQKDIGASDKAKAALASALGATLDARKRANGLDKAHSERLLARVLFRFSDVAGAARATERAFVLAGQDKRELAATVLEAAQRAFLKKDVGAARNAIGRGLSAELDDDDLVYGALWLLFTEKDAKARPDGTATRALASIRDDGRWPSRLAQWGLGKIKDSELVAAARTTGQKTEAAFYTALAKRIAGENSADSALAEIAKSAAIDLVEVQLARELLSGPSRFANGPVPAGMTIP